jgi:hypothetical protein
MSDRRLWLEQPCPSCHARSGLQSLRRQAFAGVAWRARVAPSLVPVLQGADRALCRTPTDRQAGAPHTARLSYGRRELFADEDVWRELERWGATVALVRFSGGGGRPGSIAAVTLEDGEERAGSVGAR